MQSPLDAQVQDTTRTRPDSARVRRDSVRVLRDTTGVVVVPVPPGADSLLQRDSLARRPDRVVDDSIKDPLAAAESPVLADPMNSFVWTRRDMFSTGALTVSDLLDRVAGVTPYRSGWIAHPTIASFQGDPARVRVFLDGLELVELDPRMDGRWELTQIPIWALDELRIERGASELRIHMKSWRVERTTPYTRADIYTGDQSTNLYRGLFGRRYRHGEVLQAAAQQYGTSPGRISGTSDQLGTFGRIGWAADGWSVDAALIRLNRTRASLGTTPSSTDSIPPTESTRTDAYARVGYGRAGEGLWVQGLASTSKYVFGGIGEQTGSNLPETEDTTRSHTQYVATGGYGLGPWTASFTQRLVVGANRHVATPSARASFETDRLVVSAFAEGRGRDSTRRADVSAVLRPLPFVYVAGAAGSERHLNGDSVEAPLFTRAEAGIRFGDVWLSGGILQRGRIQVAPLGIFRSGGAPVDDSSATAVFATIRGRLYKALYADVHAIQWDDTAAFYRPRHRVRSELYISTPLLDRFPTGNFHFLLSATHEYRSTTWWPDAGGGGPIRLPAWRSLSTLLQVRIINAEIFWNFRNVLGERYSEIPGYRLPRLTNVYGVRWQFWN